MNTFYYLILSLRPLQWLKNGEMDFSGKESKHWQLQLKLAEEIGLGVREYNLIEVEIESKK